jgi:AcrR family transcriptional regulator
MEKTRKILDAALRLFVEYGFHGTPTSRIAEEAGVANGTLFNKFVTKDELIVALYVDIKTRMYNYVIENTRQGNSLKEIMKGQYLASLYWALDNKNEFLFVEQFKTSPFLSLIAPEEIEKSVKPYLDLIQLAIDEKIVKPLPVDYLFMLISSQTYGLNQYLLKNEFPKAKQHQIISDTFELLWNMIT